MCSRVQKAERRVARKFCKHAWHCAKHWKPLPGFPDPIDPHADQEQNKIAVDFTCDTPVDEHRHSGAFPQFYVGSLRAHPSQVDDDGRGSKRRGQGSWPRSVSVVVAVIVAAQAAEQEQDEQDDEDQSEAASSTASTVAAIAVEAAAAEQQEQDDDEQKHRCNSVLEWLFSKPTFVQRVVRTVVSQASRNGGGRRLMPLRMAAGQCCSRLSTAGGNR